MIDDENTGIASAMPYDAAVAMKKKTGKKYPSQELPQLHAVRFGDEDVWILDAIEQFRSDFMAEHGMAIEQAQVVRKALSETLAKLGKKRIEIDQIRTRGTRGKLGPTRVTPNFPTLIADVEAAAKRSEIHTTDVIRWALEKWLRLHRYGPKG